jgi:serine/threonine-protein kinase
MFVEAPPDHMVGIVLGGAYQLVGCIGQGGMGVVYEAHHLRLHNRVAVKLMNRTNASHQEALIRFRREALLASRLGHPHLVNVSDFGTSEDGQPYLVMEFLEGEDLDHRIQRAGPVPLHSAVHIARQTASAVAAVHAKGIVHRDLKPANIFLVHVPGEPDFVKVLDFGVSKIRAARTKVTDASKAVGTPEYMSPEQVLRAGDEVDHRTDQWALACIVWEMLAGRLPFTADDPDVLFYKLRNLPPPPLAKYVADLPPAVESVLLRALSKRPADRYPSIREFARGLESAAFGPWAEIAPLESDPMVLEATIVDAFPGPSESLLEAPADFEAPPELAGERGPLSTPETDLVFSGQQAPRGTAERHWMRLRNTKIRAAFMVLAVTMAGALGGLLFASGRNGASAASPALPVVTRALPRADIPPAAPSPRPDSAAEAQGTPVSPPSTAPATKGRMGRTKSGLASKAKRSHGRATSGVADRAGRLHSQRLTIDDF